MNDIFGKYGSIRQIRVGTTPETKGGKYGAIKQIQISLVAKNIYSELIKGPYKAGHSCSSCSCCTFWRISSICTISERTLCLRCEILKLDKRERKKLLISYFITYCTLLHSIKQRHFLVIQSIECHVYCILIVS